MSRRGRPPLPPDVKYAAELALNLTTADYAALTAMARTECVAVQTIIRRAIAHYLQVPTSRTRRSVTVTRRVGL